MSTREGRLRPGDVCERWPGTRPDQAEALIADTGGLPALVDAVVEGVGLPMPDSSAGLARMIATSAAVRRLDDWIVEHQWPVVRYLAVAGVCATAELEELAAAAMIAELWDAGLVALSAVDGLDGVALVPAVGRAVAERLATNPEESEGARRAVVGLRERSGVMDCGLGAAYAADDHEACARILARWSLRLAFSPWRALSLSVLSELPSELVKAYPLLSLRQEYIGHTPVGATTIPIPEGESARRALIRDGRDRELVEQSIFAMAARRNFGLYEEALEHAERMTPFVLQELRAEHAASAGLSPLWLLQSGVAAHLTGAFGRARFFYRTGWRHRAFNELPFVSHDLAVKQAVLSAHEGRTRRAFDWLRQAEGSEFPAPVVEQIRHWVDSGTGFVRHTLATDALDADGMAREAWQVDEGAEADELWPLLLWSRVRHMMVDGEAAEGLTLVDDLRDAAPFAVRHSAFHRDVCLASSAEARLALGHGSEARLLLTRLDDSSVLGRPTWVRLLLASDQAQEAFERASDSLLRIDTPIRDRTELTLLRAAAARRLGDDETAAADRGRGVAEALRRQDRRVLLTVPRSLLETEADRSAGLRDVLADFEREGREEIFPESVEVVALSVREQIVLEQLTTGRKVSEIADSLTVSLNTVKTQLRSVYGKLGVGTRSEAVAEARRLGLLD
ncbi:MAG: LuxR C-terminal-related transcriptional regulator [Aeromicrobium sp.]|uniref:helix-turn-helix transcriptional regulator n=1 Tax=Aeromicrobium sp. TaxID=1871063 RepID=UPI0039E6406F